MRYRTPIQQRRVFRIASKIDRGRIIAAVEALKLKYGIPRTGLDTRGVPTGDVTSKRVKSRHTEHDVCGMAFANHSFVLYETALHARSRKGFLLKLSVLETSLHEIIHTIAGILSFPGTQSSVLSTRQCTTIIEGFREVFFYNDESHKTNPVGNELFDEGVTQLFTLELMREYLALGPFLGVTKKEIDEYFENIRARKLGTFYPDATSFVEAFVSRIGEVVGTERTALEMLYRSLFAGTSLQDDADWVRLMKAASIDRIMFQARNCPYDSLPIYEAQLRKTRGVWDGIKLATNLRLADEQV